MTGSTGHWEPTPQFWRDRPVAVTGATGFLGSHLTAQLVGLGAARGRARARRRAAARPSASAGPRQVAAVRGAVEDQALVERLLGEYEVAHGLPPRRAEPGRRGQPQPGRHLRGERRRARGRCSRRAAGRRASSRSSPRRSDKAYGAQPDAPLRRGHAAARRQPLRRVQGVRRPDRHAATTDTFGVPVCITRCGNFFGPGDRNWERLVPGTIRSLLRGERPGHPLRRHDGARLPLRRRRRAGLPPARRGHGRATRRSSARPSTSRPRRPLDRARAGRRCSKRRPAPTSSPTSGPPPPTRSTSSSCRPTKARKRARLGARA